MPGIFALFDRRYLLSKTNTGWLTTARSNSSSEDSVVMPFPPSVSCNVGSSNAYQRAADEWAHCSHHGVSEASRRLPHTSAPCLMLTKHGTILVTAALPMQPALVACRAGSSRRVCSDCEDSGGRTSSAPRPRPVRTNAGLTGNITDVILQAFSARMKCSTTRLSASQMPTFITRSPKSSPMTT
jgi:hypothetical protein